MFKYYNILYSLQYNLNISHVVTCYALSHPELSFYLLILPNAATR